MDPNEKAVDSDASKVQRINTVEIEDFFEEPPKNRFCLFDAYHKGNLDCDVLSTQEANAEYQKKLSATESHENQQKKPVIPRSWYRPEAGKETSTNPFRKALAASLSASTVNYTSSLPSTSNQPGPSTGTVERQAYSTGELQPVTGKQIRGNAILVNQRQRGNPILKHIHNVAWEYAEIDPDYLVGRNHCVYFLSLRYHNLNPEYIFERLRKTKQNYQLSVLLCHVDIADPHYPLKELAKFCLSEQLVLMLAWTAEEAARYLEAYKALENKPPDGLMPETASSTDHLAQITEFLTAMRPVTKADAASAISRFKTVSDIVMAKEDALEGCPGFGRHKAQRETWMNGAIDTTLIDLAGLSALRVDRSNPKGHRGSYSDSLGLWSVRQDVAAYIERRDGIPAIANNIFLSCGATEAIKINYYLDESKNWALNVSELERALKQAKGHCVPRAIAVINPGNPTAQVLSRECMEQVIRFAIDNHLVLLADEVYQFNIYHPDKLPWLSFRRVLHEMGPSVSGRLELASFMSCSKGYMGECGFRGGYCELTNFNPDVQAQLYKALSARICPPVLGQAMVGCVVDPPKPDEPSYKTYTSERDEVLRDLKYKAEIVSKTLNALPGMSCTPIQGAMYAFPQIHLTQKAIQAAKDCGQKPDFFYCMQFLEEKGVCMVPGSGFGQVEGTYHFRTTILPSVNKIKYVLDSLTDFHNGFMTKYAD